MPKIRFTGERMIPELNIGYTFYYEHINRYLFSLQFVKDKNVLDLGCGVGYGSFILSQKAKSVLGIDRSKQAISYAKVKYKKNNIQFISKDVLLFDSNDLKFDVIVCYEFIEHVKDQNKILNLVKRLLTKNGLFIISTPNKRNYKVKNKFHLKELSRPDFKKLLTKSFKNIEFMDQYFWFSNNIVKSDTKSKTEFDTNFKNFNSIYPAPSGDKSQYLIAVCSDTKIDTIVENSLATNSVDDIDLSSGVETIKIPTVFGLEKISDIRSHLEELIILKSSKWYKLSRYYNRLKNVFR